MKKILISACLAGDLVRYDGRRRPFKDDLLNQWHKKGLLVKVCPEVSGGLPVPRPEAQIVNGSAVDVFSGKAKVLDIQGHDITSFFVRGAEDALSIARRFGIDMAILKEKSPSCGVHHVYDGRFASHLIPGVGITAELLQQNGIKVFSENELAQAALYYR